MGPYNNWNIKFQPHIDKTHYIFNSNSSLFKTSQLNKKKTSCYLVQ